MMPNLSLSEKLAQAHHEDRLREAERAGAGSAAP
jgi:hypothetical protein